MPHGPIPDKPADETHRMTLAEVAAFAETAGLTVQVDDRIPPNALVISTANGCEVVSVPNADPVALAIERHKRDR